MIKPLGWARVKAPGAHMLRRGAWYPVVNNNASTLVFLDIAKRNIAVPRALLQIRRRLSDTFSVVMRAPEDPNPVRGTAADLGLTYAVCPATGARVRLPGHPDALPCPCCGVPHKIAWEEAC